MTFRFNLTTQRYKLEVQHTLEVDDLRTCQIKKHGERT